MQESIAARVIAAMKAAQASMAPKEAGRLSEEAKLDTTTYIAYREALDKAELEVSGRYDQWIMTLSGGALGLSVTFLEKIAPHPKETSVCFLVAAWLSLVSSLLAALVSLLTSQSAIREIRQDLDESKTINPHRRFSAITNFLNWFSAVLFVVGTGLFCWFTIINLPQ